MTAVSAPNSDPGVAGPDASWALKSPDPRGQEPVRKPALAGRDRAARGTLGDGRHFLLRERLGVDAIGTSALLSATYRRYLRSLLPVRDPALAAALADGFAS